MKFVPFLLSLLFFAPVGYAASECSSADGKAPEPMSCTDGAIITAANESALPAEALAQVNELKSQMRYFKAIGFHKQSKEKRDEIAAIYATHGLALPDEYND